MTLWMHEHFQLHTVTLSGTACTGLLKALHDTFTWWKYLSWFFFNLEKFKWHLTSVAFSYIHDNQILTTMLFADNNQLKFICCVKGCAYYPLSCSLSCVILVTSKLVYMHILAFFFLFQEDFEEALNILQICQEDYHASMKPDWFCVF